MEEESLSNKGEEVEEDENVGETGDSGVIMSWDVVRERGTRSVLWKSMDS